jgi:hypothetical protein
VTLQAVLAPFQFVCCGINIVTFLRIFLRFTPNSNSSTLLPSLNHHNHPHNDTFPTLCRSF